MSTTITHTAAIMTSEVPLATGDVFRTTHTPAIPPPHDPSPPTTDGGGVSQKKNQSQSPTQSHSQSHKRTSSTASDMARAAGIDIEAVSMAEARKIMSEEHKILGFRPPHGSFAAEVQSVASKHPEGRPGTAPVDTTRLREIAREDALRILAERKTSPETSPVRPTAAAKVLHDGGGAETAGGEAKLVATAPVQARHAPRSPGINLNTINATDARILMSHEHRALGFRPPPGSLAAEAQSAAAHHPEGDGSRVDDNMLREVAVRDAERIKADREIGEAAAAEISASVSQEAKTQGQEQSAGERFLEGFAPGKSPVEMAILKEKSRDEAGSDGQGGVQSQSLNGDS
ncbi:hypothetical protein GSI_11828 [Ganoderma sinense ZZ0214-1]|uniref:SMP domain-containing protein n=1 Tax=Ganoderma sinense ZZ0214-1 TaxID=1077348 RepID=A0A2G8RX60_9APHY|nr:hypothetical protein GSI_11828 [Ganoderma sinense ZZ0214-1]